MSGFYSEAIKSLPKYRRNQDPSIDCSNTYVEKPSSDIPCSPRLIKRNNHQKRVVTRMLRSYPQADGSVVCPVPQPNRTWETPPPLPAKARDRQSAKVTVQVPYKRNRSASDIANGPRYHQSNHLHRNHQLPLGHSMNQQRPLLYQLLDEQSNGSMPHQPLARTTSNGLCNNSHDRPAYIPTHDHNGSQVSPSHQINSDSSQPFEASSSSQPQALFGKSSWVHSIRRTSESRGATVAPSTALHHAKATYLHEAVISRSTSLQSNLSESSSSTYTGSMENSVPTIDGKGRAQEWTKRQSNSFMSSVDSTTEPDDTDSIPELYPEHRFVTVIDNDNC